MSDNKREFNEVIKKGIKPQKESEDFQTGNKKMIYKSEVMSRLLGMVYKMAASQSSVLILGESGTGKELIAQTLHESSNRKKAPFIMVNCGTLQESLLESELFGHEKGAFTGAYSQKVGFVEKAHQGTLFLDEVGELSLGIQSKLLRFLQSGEFYRVGGKELLKVDIRLISATNKALEKEVEVSQFREDLFYRINTIVLKTSPLRRRREDIKPLFNFFMSQKAKGSQVISPCLKVDSKVYRVLEEYKWPGNVRELQNLCERLHVTCESNSTIRLEHLPYEIVKNQTIDSERFYLVEYDSSITLAELERQYILQALTYFKCNKTQVANALGITIKTLYNKLHEYGEFERFAMQEGRKKTRP